MGATAMGARVAFAPEREAGDDEAGDQDRAQYRQQGPRQRRAQHGRDDEQPRNQHRARSHHAQSQRQGELRFVATAPAEAERDGGGRDEAADESRDAQPARFAAEAPCDVAHEVERRKHQPDCPQLARAERLVGSVAPRREHREDDEGEDREEQGGAHLVGIDALQRLLQARLFGQ